MFDRWWVAGTLLALMASGPTMADEAWPERMYNPQKVDGDLILPMPCGGAMAFRRIELPASGLLGDRRVQLGGSDESVAYAENTRTEYIGGGFSDSTRQGVRAYFIGKYEVTQAQFAAFKEPCGALSGDSRLPAVNLTWAEAVALSAQYSAWLIDAGTAELPSEDGAPGFLRLPTEAEWEFAARGGAAVADSVFIERTFPTPEGLTRYAWHQGTDSANNELNVIGLLKPNPLGLHDVLGNVSEFVLDPFRLNKLSRLHGQAGGQMVKGGDYRTPAAELRSAARVEFVPVDKHGERRSSTSGFRLALVPPSLPSTDRLVAMRTAWAELPSSAVAPQDDPVKEAEALAQSVESPDLRKRISALSTVIKASIQSRNEQRDRAAVNAIRVGAYVADKLASDLRILKVRQSLLQLSTAGTKEHKERTDGLAAAQQAFDGNVDYYLDVVLSVAADYPASVVAAQAEVLKREFEGKQITGLTRRVDPFVGHVEELRTGRSIDRVRLLSEIQ